MSTTKQRTKKAKGAAAEVRADVRNLADPRDAIDILEAQVREQAASIRSLNAKADRRAENLVTALIALNKIAEGVEGTGTGDIAQRAIDSITGRAKPALKSLVKAVALAKKI